MRIVYLVEPKGDDEPWEASNLLFQAWWDYPELRMRKYEDFADPLIHHISNSDRIEISAYVDEVKVAGLVLMDGTGDPHVGDTLDVVMNYTLPEYRGKGIGARLYRMALRKAKELNYPVLAYTHRVGDWEYKTKYRKL